MTIQERKKVFIRALAKFLCENQARQSIELQMGKQSAREWVELRNTTPISGWIEAEEAIPILEEFLQ